MIIDLRENEGGDRATVAHIASYLFSRRTHLDASRSARRARPRSSDTCGAWPELWRREAGIRADVFADVLRGVGIHVQSQDAQARDEHRGDQPVAARTRSQRIG